MKDEKAWVPYVLVVWLTAIIFGLNITHSLQEQCLGGVTYRQAGQHLVPVLDDGNPVRCIEGEINP